MGLYIYRFMRRHFALSAVCILGFSGFLSVRADPPVDSSRDGTVEAKRFTPHDLWALARVGGPKLSPDGRHAVYPVQRWSIEENKATTHLWLVEVDTGKVRQLTAAPDATDGSPVWSHDSRQIAFISRRADDEAAALYVISVEGGEAQEVVELPFGVSNPEWLPDGSALIVVTQAIPELVGKWSADDRAAMKKEIKRRGDSKMTAKATSDRFYRFFDTWYTEGDVQRFLKVDVKTKQLTDLTPTWDRFFTAGRGVEYDVAPDGRTLVASLNSTLPPYREPLNTDLYLIPTDGSGKIQNLTPQQPRDDSSPRFSPDGSAVLYGRNLYDVDAGEFTKLFRLDLASGESVRLAETIDLSFEQWRYSDDGRSIFFVAEDRGSMPLFRLNADGMGLTRVYDRGTISSYDVAKTGTVVILHETFNSPPEVFALDQDRRELRALSRVNDEALKPFRFGAVESYSFTGAAGDMVQGWVIFPPEFDSAKTYPLIQLMHGGPHTMVRDGWQWRWHAHTFAANGYVVTWVNRHGSTGFGEAFARSILGEWGAKPTEDVLRSTDFLLAKYPNLDPKRVAAAGASYGGYLAAWLLGHTDRFACIVDHAGVNDLHTQYAGDLTYGWDRVHGARPWENHAMFLKNNPMASLENFRTPTLVTHGLLDYRVPSDNGLALYGMLQAKGVPSRLVFFMDENHWILKPQNSIYWYYELSAWWAKYLGGQALPKPEFGKEEKE